MPGTAVKDNRPLLEGSGAQLNESIPCSTSMRGSLQLPQQARMLARECRHRLARTKLPRRRGEAGRCVRQVGVVVRARPRHKRLTHRSTLTAWQAAAGAGESACMLGA